MVKHPGTPERVDLQRHGIEKLNEACIAGMLSQKSAK